MIHLKIEILFYIYLAKCQLKYIAYEKFTRTWMQWMHCWIEIMCCDCNIKMMLTIKSYWNNVIQKNLSKKKKELEKYHRNSPFAQSKD